MEDRIISVSLHLCLNEAAPTHAKLPCNQWEFYPSKKWDQGGHTQLKTLDTSIWINSRVTWEEEDF